MFHKQRLDAKLLGLKLCQKGQHQSVKTISGREFEYSQLASLFFCSGFFRKNATEHQQLHQLCLDNNQFENNTKKLLSPADLTRASTFGVHKLTKVVVIGKDEDLMFVAF